MWNKLPFEIKLEDSLKQEFGNDEGEKWFSKYVSARDYLIQNVYDQIKGSEPQLSDHGARHIANVLKNVDFILKDTYKSLSSLNLYCLGIIVLFHDVGNIHGRRDHHMKIADVYNKCRSQKPEFNQERYCVLTAAKAHTGFNAQGETDTLKDVPETTHLDGQRIQLRDLAAILRLADECAEGYQRTSDYMNQTQQYAKESQIFHEYAAITNVFIDSGGGRIVLTYHVEINEEQNKEGWVDKMSSFILKRVCKLDIERRYCKHYTNLLYNYKKTEVTINFSLNGLPFENPIGPLVIEDPFPIPVSDSTIQEEEILGKNQIAEIRDAAEKAKQKISSNETDQQ